MSKHQKVWFITGTSRGFGREWAIAALQRGDSVAATARDATSSERLVADYGNAVLPIQLDVTDRQACFDAIRRAHKHFGRLDIVVNNAGYGQLGFIEELSEREARAQFDTNVFGALWITQAALPLLRQQRGGHIIQVSSIGGITAFAGSGIYNSSKWALEGFSHALAWEVAPFGIHVTLIEPGSFSTTWSEGVRHSSPLVDYSELHQTAAETQKLNMSSRGDPRASARALMKIVDGPNPPLRVFFGANALELAMTDYNNRIKSWRQWQLVAHEAHGTPE
ncbi:SDR family oxidoreductase [Mycobacterium avium]|uniref:SDR family oxidoreductase n=1 Tax=Mycobacterium avium TaxID=1764 RepID=UPI001CC51FFC|nr:SDR family oxidoreductase [Mycobacterium avium]MBZ4535732.1 SDR family oxidoreductase [Mycobacterium avium subsp. hominissuis]MBZ4592959.1 SDR family oxidoreductase [Mycobacterium avium subsp. hominissuis]MBZ4635932.1 SDR family oxidoreductase [Mycobacterium avium subsp. hominissuis]